MGKFLKQFFCNHIWVKIGKPYLVECGMDKRVDVKCLICGKGSNFSISDRKLELKEKRKLPFIIILLYSLFMTPEQRCWYSTKRLDLHNYSDAKEDTDGEVYMYEYTCKRCEKKFYI